MAEAFSYRSHRPPRFDPNDLPTEGEKVPEAPRQRVVRFDIVSPLDVKYARRPDVFVASDMFVHSHQTDERGAEIVVSAAPDLLVAFGAAAPERGHYAIRDAGKAPDFVLEILSSSTWTTDVEDKPGIYRSMGVGEYFLFDPDDRLQPCLQGCALRDGRYRRLPPTRMADGGLRLRSEALGLDLCAVGPRPDLRWHDPQTRRHLPTHEEDAAARRAAEDQAAAEATARAAAEAQVARLQEELRRARERGE